MPLLSIFAVFSHGKFTLLLVVTYIEVGGPIAKTKLSLPPLWCLDLSPRTEGHGFCFSLSMTLGPIPTHCLLTM